MIVIRFEEKNVFTKKAETLQKFAHAKPTHADEETAPPLFPSALQPIEADKKE